MTMIFPHHLHKGLKFGVELEIEASGLYAKDAHFDEETEEEEIIEADVPEGWRQVVEHSIDGPEVIFNQPEDYVTGVELIHNVFRDIERQGYRPQRTCRGSTHVHVNVSDLTWEQLESFMFACAWAEPLLIELAGTGRRGNLFAMPYYIAPALWGPIVKALAYQNVYFDSDTHYAAINFAAIGRQGSVEFRMWPSSRNAEEAIQFLNWTELVAFVGRTKQVSDKAPPIFFEPLLRQVPAGVRVRSKTRAMKAVSELALRLKHEKREAKGHKEQIAKQMAAYTQVSHSLQEASVTWEPLPTLTLNEYLAMHGPSPSWAVQSDPLSVADDSF